MHSVSGFVSVCGLYAGLSHEQRQEGSEEAHFIEAQRSLPGFQ